MSGTEQERASTEFEAESKQARLSFLSELCQWLKHNKKWWLLPIIIVMLLLGLIVFLGEAGVGPFIYSVF